MMWAKLKILLFLRRKHYGVMMQKIYARRFEVSLWWSDKKGMFSCRVTI